MRLRNQVLLPRHLCMRWHLRCLVNNSLLKGVCMKASRCQTVNNDPVRYRSIQIVLYLPLNVKESSTQDHDCIPANVSGSVRMCQLLTSLAVPLLLKRETFPSSNYLSIVDTPLTRVADPSLRYGEETNLLFSVQSPYH